VNTEQLIEEYVDKATKEVINATAAAMRKTVSTDTGDSFDEDEMSAILADMASM
jgi:hypothetical protein